MTAGSSTTEHKRALRAEVVCSALGAVGCFCCARGGQWLIGALLLMLAMGSYCLLAVFYSGHRSALKQAEAEGAAAMRVAELAMPKQRVV